MAMARIWRNRIEAGTQRLSKCPPKYRSQAIALIQEDLETGDFSINDLMKLVEDGMMTPEEYAEITGEEY